MAETARQAGWDSNGRRSSWRGRPVLVEGPAAWGWAVAALGSGETRRRLALGLRFFMVAADLPSQGPSPGSCGPGQRWEHLRAESQLRPQPPHWPKPVLLSHAPGKVALTVTGAYTKACHRRNVFSKTEEAKFRRLHLECLHGQDPSERHPPSCLSVFLPGTWKSLGEVSSTSVLHAFESVKSASPITWVSKNTVPKNF